VKKSWVIAFIFVIIITVFLFELSFAEEGYLGYEGGISSYKDIDPKKTKLDYYEYTFVTGEPILLTGTVDTKIKTTGTQANVSYTYDLKSCSNKDLIKRTVAFKGKLTKQDNGSITKEYTISKYDETLTVNGSVYKLINYEFSKSSAVDVNPGVNFYQGAWSITKSYDSGLQISINGKNYGYDGYWGSGEFQKAQVPIKTQSWMGVLDENLSLVQKMVLEFDQNNPPSSITGAYIIRSKVEGNMDISYDMPVFSQKGEPTLQRKRQRLQYKIEKSPVVRTAIIPTLPKVKGYQYEEAINTAFSFNGFDSYSDFSPNEYITRAQFARLLMEGLNIYSNYYNPKTTQKKSIYKDVPLNHKYYGYIYAITKANIMQGKSSGYFKPEDYLTRAEAAVIVAKAIGFNKKITSPITQTDYIDDANIPVWAKDSVKLLKDSNIMLGSELNEFLPQKNLTKGEASMILLNLINYLRNDLPQSYLNMSIFHND